MATLDFTPLFRSTIGFDQLPGLLSHALERSGNRLSPLQHREGWRGPVPHRHGGGGLRQGRCRDRFRSRTGCRCAASSRRLTAETYLHRGIAARAFERIFDLADYVEVTDATMGEGLLVISLKRELPEALKPRVIPINAGTFVPLGRTPSGAIEHQADAKRAA